MHGTARRNFDHCYNALVQAQHFRQYLPDLLWIDYERLTMLGVVNRMRAVDDRHKEKPRRSITWEEILHADSQASGHSDYTKKFALYCAELMEKP